MTVCNLWPGLMLSVQMSLWMLVMSLVLGSCGLLLRKLGGLVPQRGLDMGGGTARIRVVRLGGPKVRKAQQSAADAHEGGDVFMYRDSSAAPLLDLRRRFKAVMDVRDAMIRDGISLARSVKLTAQWDEILLLSWLRVVVFE